MNTEEIRKALKRYDDADGTEEISRADYMIQIEAIDWLRSLLEELAAKDKVLEWYADRDNHEIMRRIGGDFAPVTLDKGSKSLYILSKYKEAKAYEA